MLVSPSEHSPLIRALGKASDTPEKFGCDVMTLAGHRWIGWQRKAIQDLIASLHDGRLSMERAQWNRLLDLGGIVTLVIEGRMQWGTEGVLMGMRGKPFTRRQFRRLCHSINRQGVCIQHTDDQKDTAALITDTVAYHAERRTGSRRTGRPGPIGQWGKASSQDWLIHLLTSFPDIGATTAEAILDANNGAVPLQWTVTKEWLLGIPGVGPKRAESMWRALHPLEVVAEMGEAAEKTRGRGKAESVAATEAKRRHPSSKVDKNRRVVAKAPMRKKRGE